MNEYRAFQTRGNTALAVKRLNEGERGSLIDYDIARRSFEARQRLAQRQQNNAALAPATSKSVLRRGYCQSRMTLQDIVVESYRPQRSIPQAFGEMFHALKTAVSSHPFTGQLKMGSAAGRDTHKITYRQFLSSSAICMVLAAVIIFVGA